MGIRAAGPLVHHIARWASTFVSAFHRFQRPVSSISSRMSGGISAAKCELFAGHRMDEPQLRGVQRLAGEAELPRAVGRKRTWDRVHRQDLPIADGRLTQVNAHLVGSAGFQAAFDQRGSQSSCSDRLVMRDRVFAARGILVQHRHFLAVGDPTVRSRPSIVPVGGDGWPGADRQIGAARSSGRRTAAPALHAPRRSWPPPAGRRCPCRSGGRCRAARPRRFPTSCRRGNGAAAH